MNITFQIVSTIYFYCLLVIMVMKMSRKHNASLKKQAEEMNEAKLGAKSARAGTTESTLEGASTTIVSEDSVDLPAPASIEEHFSSDDEELCDEDYEGELTGEGISAIYSDWISEMKRIDKQKMAMMLYDNYVERIELQKTEAANEVGLFFGVNEQTVRLLRREFLCSGEFSEDNRGKHARY